MKKAYPTFIAKSSGMYLVYVPDMEIYTEGTSIVDAIEMARDAIGLKGITLEDMKQDIPEASAIDEVIEKAQTDIFDYSAGTSTLVDVDFTEYRRKTDNKMVRRNVTLPNWMNHEAEKLGLNVSRVLQDALADKIQNA
jgi:predicted RNase H-like HicB family nuclease